MINIRKIINIVKQKIKNGEIELKYNDSIDFLENARVHIACVDFKLHDEEGKFYIHEQVKKDDEESFEEAKVLLICRLYYVYNMGLLVRDDDIMEEKKNDIIELVSAIKSIRYECKNKPEVKDTKCMHYELIDKKLYSTIKGDRCTKCGMHIHYKESILNITERYISRNISEFVKYDEDYLNMCTNLINITESKYTYELLKRVILHVDDIIIE